jgi:hypothetical protein
VSEVRIDGSLCNHVKTWTILDLDSVGLWTLCLAYCAEELTDGIVPAKYIQARAPKPDRRGTVKALLDAGWLERLDNGDYRVPQYLDHNPSREEVLREAEAAEGRVEKAKRAAAARWSEDANGNASSNAPSNAASNAGSNAQPDAGGIRDKRGSSTTTSSKDGKTLSRPGCSEQPRPDVDRLCSLLAELVVANGAAPHAVDWPSDAWRREARLLLDTDLRHIPKDQRVSKAEALIRWCQADAFWKANVRGMPKFRKQYDTLRARAVSEHELKQQQGSKFQRAGKVTALGGDHACRHRDCDTPINNAQANNQWGMCDVHYAERVAELEGAA